MQFSQRQSERTAHIHMPIECRIFFGLLPLLWCVRVWLPVLCVLIHVNYALPTARLLGPCVVRETGTTMTRRNGTAATPSAHFAWLDRMRGPPVFGTEIYIMSQEPLRVRTRARRSHHSPCVRVDVVARLAHAREHARSSALP